ncbi:hypothetical protein CRYUN_Cryun10bG0015600 [Craigia yunnanensis]
MDGNKDEALRCVHIAEEAIASGNKERALEFIKMAQRLNHSLSVDQLLVAFENLDFGSSPVSPVDEKCVFTNGNKGGSSKLDEGFVGERSYTEEHVQLIRQIKRNKDYYSILGVEKTCLVDEIRKAYKKLPLKVHPDKNKAPGSEEAFKKRRRRYGHDLFDDDFDPDEIFRSFFGQGICLGRLMFAGLEEWVIPKTTEKYGVEFYVRSSAFDVNFPHGSPARANIEDNMIKDYKHMLWRYCHVERQKRHWNKNFPTPHCNKLQNLGLA